MCIRKTTLDSYSRSITMDDDGDDKDDCKRKSRNLSEKKRRDQFNMLVNELSTMVSTNSRKMDKSTVLKATISFLRHQNEVTVRSRVNEIQEDWKPTFLSNEEFTHLILEALDGFMMVFSTTGRIFYASESITSLLGHLPSDLINTSIYDITYEEDKSYLYEMLQNSKDIQDETDAENHMVFSCNLRRNCLDFREEPTYDLVQFIGYFRNNEESHEGSDVSPGMLYDFSDIDTRFTFICIGRLRTPQLITEVSMLDSSNSEFTSRHSLEWKFLFLDHRAPPIIGYLPFEVLGTSGYDYYHFDDLENVISCHESLMQKGEGTSCFYRFLTKGQQWIWLQTRFYITYHQWNSKPEFVVCTHRVISCIDIMRNIKKDASESQEFDSNSRSMDKKSFTYHSPVSPQMAGGSSYAQNSSWTRLSSNPSRNTATPESSFTRKKYRQSSSVLSTGPGSDTGSISAESIISKQSSNTHRSSQSREMQDRKEPSVPPSYNQESLIQPSALMISEPLHPQQPLPQFLEPPQYVAVPVQPVLRFPPIQSLPPGPEVGVLITPAQAQMQEELQKKHEEIRQMILLQQEELRKVSQQLVMARYGLLPPIINVSVPFSIQGPPGGPSGPPEMYTAGALPPVPPRPYMDPSVPHIAESTNYSNSYIPMQMSQQQAQLLFSSPNPTPNLDRQM